MGKIVIIFLPINLNMCFGCSKESSHGDSSFEYSQHMFWMRNKENSFPIHTLIWRSDVLFSLFQSLNTAMIFKINISLFFFAREIGQIIRT